MYVLTNLMLCILFYSMPDGVYSIHITFSFLVYKYPYLLAFTEDAVEIRTTSNGSLVKNIGAPNLHLISYKVNIYFCFCDYTWEMVFVLSGIQVCKP